MYDWSIVLYLMFDWSLVLQEYIIHVDPVSQLGLNSDSVLGYSIGDIHRTHETDTPELLPCGYLVGDSDTISVSLKGMGKNGPLGSLEN